MTDCSPCVRQNEAVVEWMTADQLTNLTGRCLSRSRGEAESSFTGGTVFDPIQDSSRTWWTWWTGRTSFKLSQGPSVGAIPGLSLGDLRSCGCSRGSAPEIPFPCHSSKDSLALHPPISYQPLPILSLILTNNLLLVSQSALSFFDPYCQDLHLLTYSSSFRQFQTLVSTIFASLQHDRTVGLDRAPSARTPFILPGDLPP